MSPILWNIFYDALLVELQELKGYTFTKSIKISALAYADDIHPITENQIELQTMIDLINNFIIKHSMKLNAHKSKIISNNTIVDHTYHIGEQRVKKMLPSELVRILGVYKSMDGNYKPTIKKRRKKE